MDKLMCAYEKHENTHCWIVKGPLGAVHVWARKHSGDWNERFGKRYIGGIECHSPKPQWDGQDVSCTKCWILEGDCYHDGSSLQFCEDVEPDLPRNEEEIRKADGFVFPFLRNRYHAWFTPPQEGEE